ncbi:MAG: transport permease protein [Herpetosiphonaceae bacterium]|nr:MAG: transport permease protein [Herpetosiphonaceae bacterium]
MRSLTTIVSVEWKLLLREPTSFIFILLFPSLMALLLGLQQSDQQVATAQTLSFLGISPMVFGLMAFPITLVTYRERGMLRRLRVTPLSPLLYLVAQALVGMVMVVLGGLLLVIVGLTVLQIAPPVQPLGVAAAFLLGTLAFIAMGSFLSSVITTVRGLQVASTILFGGMMFALFVAGSPDASPTVKTIARWLPIEHMMRLVTGFWLPATGTIAWESVLFLLVLIGASLLIAARLFRWD